MTEKHHFHDLFAGIKRQYPEANVWVKGEGFLDNPNDTEPAPPWAAEADKILETVHSNYAFVEWNGGLPESVYHFKTRELLLAMESYGTDLTPAILAANESIANIIGFLENADPDDERTQFLVKKFNKLLLSLRTIYAGLLNFHEAQKQYLEQLLDQPKRKRNFEDDRIPF